VVYDLEGEGVRLIINGAHDSDVNSVCFADDSGNLLVSGSDDCTCKVWDRRILGNGRSGAVGVCIGHTEGITHVDARKDGRYFISNGKDQQVKLWDVRCMRSHTEARGLQRFRSPFRWDYRMNQYPGGSRHAVRHPHDTSIASFTGHKVLQTLIRCYFSPLKSTGQRYLYSGSHDGTVHVWDILSGETAAVLAYHGSVVRDCSWHPQEPGMMASVSWDGTVVGWHHDPDVSRDKGSSPVGQMSNRLDAMGWNEFTSDESEASDSDEEWEETEAVEDERFGNTLDSEEESMVREAEAEDARQEAADADEE